MGAIREIATGLTVLLEAEHSIGRAPGSALRLDRSYVSTLHATLRWSGTEWRLRDLGSRNGTFVDGTRLTPGVEHALTGGARIGFGKLEDDQWELVDSDGPAVMAIPLDGGPPSLIDGDLIALPSPQDPQAVLFQGTDGGWVLEHADAPSCPLANGQTFEVAGRAWRLSCTDVVHTTSLATGLGNTDIANVALSFLVSSDEEHVEVRATMGAKSVDLGARSHNYLLLTLARKRLADHADGLPETSCGWIYQDDLAHDPSMAPPQLNLDVFRIRKLFGAIGVSDANHVIERRSDTRQLRIGTGHISVSRL